MIIAIFFTVQQAHWGFFGVLYSRNSSLHLYSGHIYEVFPHLLAADFAVAGYNST
jgi:hypothetical protein